MESLVELVVVALSAPHLDRLTFLIPEDLLESVHSRVDMEAFFSDLLPVGASAPTSAVTTGPVTLTGGQAYDLFYETGNGLPEILQTNFTLTAPVPEPASMMLLGSTLIGLGWLRRHRRKKTIKTPTAYKLVDLEITPGRRAVGCSKA